MAEEYDTSVIFRIEAGVVSEKLIELSLKYQQLTNKQPTVEHLLILNELVKNKSCSIKQLEKVPFINARQIHNSLQALIDLEIVEATGGGSGTKYIIHKKHNVSIKDKVQYSQLKKQEKARQKEAILRYLDSCDTINNSETRTLLKLQDNSRTYVSKILADMRKENLIERTEDSIPNNVRYKRIK